MNIMDFHSYKKQGEVMGEKEEKNDYRYTELNLPYT